MGLFNRFKKQVEEEIEEITIDADILQIVVTIAS